MKKKADVSRTLLFLCGLVLALILILATFGFWSKLWGIVSKREDQATMNSLDLLETEINELRDGDTRLVPYYVKDGYYLRSNLEKCHNTKLCICNDFDCDEIAGGAKGIRHFPITFDTVNIKGTEDRKVRNVEITRTQRKVTIKDT